MDEIPANLGTEGLLGGMIIELRMLNKKVTELDLSVRQQLSSLPCTEHSTQAQDHENRIVQVEKVHAAAATRSYDLWKLIVGLLLSGSFIGTVVGVVVDYLGRRGHP